MKGTPVKATPKKARRAEPTLSTSVAATPPRPSPRAKTAQAASHASAALESTPSSSHRRPRPDDLAELEVEVDGHCDSPSRLDGRHRPALQPMVAQQRTPSSKAAGRKVADKED